jgi:hypothetical protein
MGPGRKEYDAKIARFAHKLLKSGLIHFGRADADVTVLVDAGAGKVVSANEQESRIHEAHHNDTYTHTKDELLVI